jgi:hypothetical protein
MARCSIPEPQLNVFGCLVATDNELEFTQRHSVAEEKQGSDKRGLFLDIDDHHRGHRFPEVAPAAGEQACADGLTRGKERQHETEDIVREGTDAVLPGGRHTVRHSVELVIPSGRHTARHSVEQVTGVGDAGD